MSGLQQARDFLDESEALHNLIAGLSDDDLGQPTAFKSWTINTIIGHLHMWNHAADLSLNDPQGFQSFFRGFSNFTRAGTMSEFEAQWRDGLEGQKLVDDWIAFARKMAARFQKADPSKRVEWAGPSMSVRSSITARLMETWAHGQEIYDLLGVLRKNEDRIRNIVVLGLNTYGWTFKVNGLDAPEPVPMLELEGPSGENWTYGEINDLEKISGLAEEFCQVVTQTRNIADTGLKVVGDNAHRWMEMAQCFAGAPETPPKPGTRVTARR